MLDVTQMRAVAAHLAVCPQCPLTLEGLRRTRHLLQTITPPAQPTPEFWTNAYRRMRLEDATRKRTLPALPWGLLQDAFREPQRRWSAGLAAAAVAAAIAAPLMYSQPTTAPTSRPILGTPAPDSVDVSSLVQAHAESAARQPLADTDRQDVIALDNSFAVDDVGPSPADALDAGSDASP
jgi:anti-sigma factor RsiW